MIGAFQALGKTDTEAKDPTLEQAVQRLEAIVERLESGEVDLEKSIDLYLEGRKLGAKALEKLDALERRIQIVSSQSAGGELTLEDFEESDSQ